MQALLGHPAYIWLVFGALLIVVEAVTAPGLGLFLGGLGAICTGLVMEARVIPDTDTPLQFVWFFGFTTIWTVALWRPLMKFRQGSKKHDREIGNVVGDTAVVGEKGLKRGETGQVKWSGTLMNAELDPANTIEFLPAGTQVIIQSVSGTTFIVTPKK